MDKTARPSVRDLTDKLGAAYPLWKRICEMVFEKYPNGLAEWNYPGKKYGWSFRIKDKKRAIIYLLPRKNYFKVAFIFGDKAVNAIQESTIANELKIELFNAKKYAEGRGISIPVIDDSLFPDIEKLVELKLRY